MKIVSKTIATGLTYAAIGAGWVLGTKAVEIAYENGLKEKIANASKKLFRKKEES